MMTTTIPPAALAKVPAAPDAWGGDRFARAALDALAAHICILDERGVIIAVNRGWRDFAAANRGLRPGAGEGADYLAACDAAAPDPTALAMAGGIRRVLAGDGAEFACEYPCHGAGEKRWFSGRVTAFAGDGPRRVVVAHENITARRRAEEAQRAGERRFREVIEALPAAVYTCDAAGRVTLFNQAAMQLWGREPAPDGDRWGCSWRADLTGGPPMPGDESPMAQAIRENRPIRGRELVVERPDGTRSWVLPHPAPMHGAEGVPVGAVNMLVDITDRKEAEAKLATLNRQLIDTSRQAGMAEVASNVLHNVGNVLNSVNVSATVVADKVRKSKAANLGLVADLLARHEGDLGAFVASPAGKNLPVYLRQLHEAVREEREGIVSEIASLRTNIEHIKDIVAMQQSYAKISGASESVQLADLVEDTLRMNAESFAHHDLRVVRDFAAVPPVLVEKHKVLQILVNLVRNAKHACDDGPRTEKTLTLRIFNGAGTVKIAVADNGIGIPPENLTRIFQHGFTTRKNGHGFGLHASALTARELGGVLQVESPGAGAGATFTLELPVAPAR